MVAKMNERKKLTPRARRLAANRGVDTNALNDLAGSGVGGGVTESDLLAWLEQGGAETLRATPLARAIAEAEGLSLAALAETMGGAKLRKADALKLLDERAAKAAAPAPEGRDARGASGAGATTEDGKRIAGTSPYAGVRRIIGERLAASKFTSPHLYFTQKVDVRELLSLRAAVNAAQEKKTSVTDYIARAVVMALRKYPDMNASLAGDVIERYENVNLGIAVASPSGLIVPVVKDAERMSVLALSKACAPLFEKAREGKLAPDEYHGGTFTISNLGMFGIENFTAIINPPEVGILAVSATKDEPAVVTDEHGNKSVGIRPIMNITLSVDHRLIDGLLAAQFVGEVKGLLESPIALLL
jgi:pyruvate dehydrogenase E2 component (dihydrolipoamide acetyltransferase)